MSYQATIWLEQNRNMLILRCTQRLLRRRPGPSGPNVDGLVPVLGAWHANLIHLRHSAVVLFVNDASLLPVIVPGKNFANLVPTFREQLTRRLKRLGVSDAAITCEIDACRNAVIEPTNSRSVLGYMNDFTGVLKSAVAGKFDPERAGELEDSLAEIPVGPRRPYRIPRQLAQNLLIHEHSASEHSEFDFTAAELASITCSA